MRLPSATFEGSCNRDLFKAWLVRSLIPQLVPGDIIILDNATFHGWRNYQRTHRGSRLRIVVSTLPPYSPDLNKIENWWAVLKTWLRQRLKEFKTVRDCIDAAFKQCPNVLA